MSANIKLTRMPSPDWALNPELRQAWPVKIQAEGVNMDDHIFVYHIGKADDPIPGDRFECVASLNQMNELPKNSGISVTTETGIPYYRSNVLQYVCRSQSEALRIWNVVVEEVQLLVANYDAAMILQEAAFAEITSTGVVSSTSNMTPPILTQISSHPAGTAAVVSGTQVITLADPSKQGWLPASSASPSFIQPPGAAFFYNLPQDSNLSAIWPPAQPYSGNLLYRNGLLLPYNIVWTLTADTLWWLTFNPADIPGYQRVSPQVTDGNAPWCTDYVSPSDPGAVQNIFMLALFK